MGDPSSDDVSRKRRLQEIKDKAKAKTNESGQGDVDGANKKIKFRNYQPYDATLKEDKTSEESKKVSSSSSSSSTAAIASAIVATTGAAKGSVGGKGKEVDIIKLELAKHSTQELNVVPKKPNWDLKSQVSGKLEKLRKRTQRAIVEILREKITSETAADGDVGAEGSDV